MTSKKFHLINTLHFFINTSKLLMKPSVLSFFWRFSAAKCLYFVLDFCETFWPVNDENCLLERNLKLNMKVDGSLGYRIFSYYWLLGIGCGNRSIQSFSVTRFVINTPHFFINVSKILMRLSVLSFIWRSSAPKFSYFVLIFYETF